jgi:hypothetical protein
MFRPGWRIPRYLLAVFYLLAAGLSPNQRDGSGDRAPAASAAGSQRTASTGATGATYLPEPDSGLRARPRPISPVPAKLLNLTHTTCPPMCTSFSTIPACLGAIEVLQAFEKIFSRG